MLDEETIFAVAVAFPEKERRTAYLDESCVGRPELRDRMEALLRSHEVTGFMDGVAPGGIAEQCGERIDRYRLLQQIGEGGFGVVWMAEQLAPVKRRIAVKIIKAGMDSEEVTARFEAERQALAMMEHPNIAKVHDAGTTDTGRPYFVMELVNGIPITTFCDEQGFTTHQRLELVSDVCSAINHAHQKGIIHRDLKPSNILIALHEGKPVPKVIDFGIAKAIEGRLTDKTLFTRFEQFVGTPAYMSPEQASLSGIDIDTRSDIYGLGILLYELLTGKPPFDDKTLLTGGYDELRRIIREVEPPRPSTRLKTAAGGERALLAKSRHVAPGKLGRLVEPDLDWIVMKAIEKDRARRYATVNDLALDVERFLSDLPVSAGPPTAAYRFRKFARRNKAALRTIAAVAVILVAATVVSIGLAVKATRAEQRANHKAADETLARIEADSARLDAEALSQFVTGVVSRGDSERGGQNMSIGEAMNRAIADLDSKLSNPTEQETARQEGIFWMLHKIGYTRQIIPLQEKVRDFHVATYGPRHEKSLISSLNLAYYVMRGGEPDGRLEKAAGILEQLLANEPFWPQARSKEWLETLANLADCYEKLKRPDKAIAVREKLLRTCRTLHASDSRTTLNAMSALATTLCDAGQMAEAIALSEEVLAIRQRTDGPTHPKTLGTMHQLANLYHDNGRRDEALKLREEVWSLHKKVLGSENSDTLIAEHNLAESYFDAYRKADAMRLMEEVLRLRPAASGPDHIDTLEAMHDMAILYEDAGNQEAALKLRAKVLPLREKVLGAEHPDTLEAMTNLAISWRSAGRLPECIAIQEKALDISRRVLSPEHPFLKAAEWNMVEAYEAAGRENQAGSLRKEITGSETGPVTRPELSISRRPFLPNGGKKSQK